MRRGLSRMDVTKEVARKRGARRGSSTAASRHLRGDPEQLLLWTQVITGLELDEHGLVRCLDAATWQKSGRAPGPEIGRPLLT